MYRAFGLNENIEYSIIKKKKKLAPPGFELETSSLQSRDFTNELQIHLHG